MKKIDIFLLALIICFFLAMASLGLLLFNNQDCVVAKGIWLKQELRDEVWYNETYCEDCLHYSFILQRKQFDYFAQNEFSLRDDLKAGDNINIRLCWDDQVDGFLSKGVEKQ